MQLLIAAEVRKAEELLVAAAAAPLRLCWNSATSPWLWIPFPACLQELAANSMWYWAHAAAPCAVPAAPALPSFPFSSLAPPAWAVTCARERSSLGCSEAVHVPSHYFQLKGK